MLLTEITLNNFSAFEGTNKLDLMPTGISGQNITLIGAMNGSGKTSLLEAVKLCLYGERRSGLLPAQESPASFISKRFN
jgi:DNA sulfur modification protein DndD